MVKKDRKAMTAADDPWEDLVVSILSVNQYSLERTYQSIEALRKQGLFSPQSLMQWDQGEIVACLKSAGCDRGPFMTNLFALRLANLGALTQSKGLAACTKVISAQDARMIEELLLPVNGIGPKVIANFCLLRGIPKK
jgi:3-methyladenine DNA glycosylase/8-oxoguanine DNA glycosylase